MTSRAERVEALFHAAIDIDTPARRQFLSQACGGDESLRREVEALLALDATEDARLDRAAPEALALGASQPSLLVGCRLGPFVLRRCIASGGMGAVYEATQSSPERTVAVKVLRADVATPELLARFRFEAGFLARLQHAGIAHVYEAGVAELDARRVPYIAMEFVEGARPITEHAQQAGLSPRERIELFAEVCEAVQHGHLRGVIHRDLKPANILVGRDGRPKLIDFGVARAVDAGAATGGTEAGAVLGTVQYMSPEQCTDARELDVRSDVYSLGVVLYELLCGRPPYDLGGVPLPEAARIVQDAAPRRPSTVARALRGDIETILATALEKDRARRYQSADELRQDLLRFLRREPIAARAPSVPYRLALFARRHKALVGALASVSIVSFAAAAVSLTFGLRESRARRREELVSYLAHVAAADLSLRVHDASGARRHLEAVRPAQRGWEWRHLSGRVDLATRILGGPFERCDAIAWRGGRIASLWHDPGESERQCVVVWDASSGAELARMSPSPMPPLAIALAPDGRLLWSASDGSLRLWDPIGGGSEPFAECGGVAIARLCTNAAGDVGALLADGGVRVWRDGRATEVSAGADSRERATALALAPDGRRIALGCADGMARVVDVDGRLEPRLLAGHARAVLAIDFHPSGAWLASGSRDGSVRVWDLASAAEVRRLQGHESDVAAVAYLASGSLLASASYDRTVRVWDVDLGAAISVLHGHDDWLSALAASPEGDHVASGACDGTARVWDPRSSNDVRRIAGHTQIVRDVAFSPEGASIGTACFDGTARLFDAASGAVVATLGAHGGRVQAIAFDPRGARVATGANDHLVRVWDVASGALLREVTGHTDGVHAVAFAPPGRLFASGAKDGRVLVRETEGFAAVAELPHGDWVEGVAFDRGGDLLATVTRDGCLRLWSVPEKRERWSRRASAGLAAVDVAPDGRTIATASADGRILLWNLSDGGERAKLVGHTGEAYSVAFSPDGARLASASADATVRLWDPAEAVEVLVLRGHASWVWSVAFSPDGARLVSGGGNYDGTGIDVRVWESAAR